MRALAVVALVAVSACALFGPTERQQLEGDAAKLAQCQEAARACKADGGVGETCYALYDACVTDGGLR